MAFNPPAARLGFECNPCGPPEAPLDLEVERLDESLLVSWTPDDCVIASYQYRICFLDTTLSA